MKGAGYSPDRGLLTRLTMSHSDVIERENLEIAAAAAGPPEDWGVERMMAGEGGARRRHPGGDDDVVE